MEIQSRDIPKKKLMRIKYRPTKKGCEKKQKIEQKKKIKKWKRRLSKKIKKQNPKKGDLPTNRREQNLRKFSPYMTPQQYIGWKLLGNYYPPLSNRNQFHRPYVDPRNFCIKKKYFYNRDVLDLGCGEGFLSIDIARNHCPKSIYALDIDDRLLERGIARVQKSKLIIQKYEKALRDTQQRVPKILKEQMFKALKFHGMTQILKECDQSRTQPCGDHYYPNNLYFLHENFYNLDEHYTFDTIICFKVLKYIQLSFGSLGTVMLFQKIYRHLRLGGVFIFEDHTWRSYRQTQKENNIYSNNFDAMHFNPHDLNQFAQKLCKKLQIPQIKFPYYHHALEAIGFDYNKSIKTNPEGEKLQNPLYIYIKRTEHIKGEAKRE